MLGALSKLKRPVGNGRSQRRAFRIPPDMRVYAVGDIHGRADLLDALMDKIEEDSGTRSTKRRILIFLGDYIDRGPQSAEVLERLQALAKRDEDSFFLLGNHEEALMRVLGGATDLAADWLRFGGKECLISYGADPSEVDTLSPDGIVELANALVPQHHRDFLDGCDDSIVVGDYLFVHAGIRPGAALSDQRQRDLRWIREPFLGSTADHGAVVVHGHSISEAVDWQDNRIGVDTGAYRSGRLTALVLSGERRRAIDAYIAPSPLRP